MATADNTRHLRYLLLFGEGGILILRAVLEREITNSGKTLDELLQTNKGQFIKLIKKQFEKLFPPNGIVDRDTWDISLLCTVILQLFGKSLKSDERCGIRTLRDLRNDLAHCASFSRDEQAYNDERRDVESILIKLSNGLDRSVHDECQDLIQRCVTGPLDMQADTERVKELCRYDEKFSEQFRILTEKVEVISERVENIEENVEYIEEKVENVAEKVEYVEEKVENVEEKVEHVEEKVENVAEKVEYVEEKVGNVEEKVEYVAEKVKEQEDLTLFLRNMVRENADLYIFQVLRTVLTLRGPNARLTSLGNKAILTVFMTALKRTGGGENISALETEVMNILDEIERCDGVKVGDAESKCVKISMQCRTCSGLLELIEYLQGDAFRKRLLNLVLAVEEMFKGVFNITFEIERESLKEILHSLQNRTFPRPEVTGADDNPDGQSAMTVQESARLKPVPTDADVETELQKENEELLDEIIDACECIDEEDANHVILLLGSIGVGKSSFINTLHKVLTGKYFIVAKQGRGVTQSVTGELLRYNNCGVSVETLNRITDIHRRQKITQIYKKLPQIIDFAGLGNVNTPELSEILELLIGGFIPSRTSMKALEECQKNFGVGALKRVFPEANPHWKVSKIICMHSCVDEFPDKLIECLNGVLNIFRHPKLYLEYKPDIFALTSKFDLAQDQSLHPINASSEAVISLEEFEKAEKDLANKLNITGRSYRWISITDSISVHSKYVENIALKFLKSVLQPGSPRHRTSESDLGLWPYLEQISEVQSSIDNNYIFRFEFYTSNRTSMYQFINI